MKYAIMLLLGAFLAGCVSIASPFVHIKPDLTTVPADGLRAVAREIETAVQKGERDAQIEKHGGIAVNYDVIRQAIRTRAARASLINDLLNTGHAREDRNGLVSILRSKAYKKSTTAKQRDRNALLVMSENADRWTLYEGIREANKLRGKSLSAIQDIFHDARVACMSAGQKYEDAAGGTAVKE